MMIKVTGSLKSVLRTGSSIRANVHSETQASQQPFKPHIQNGFHEECDVLEMDRLLYDP